MGKVELKCRLLYNTGEYEEYSVGGERVKTWIRSSGIGVTYSKYTNLSVEIIDEILNKPYHISRKYPHWSVAIEIEDFVKSSNKEISIRLQNLILILEKINA